MSLYKSINSPLIICQEVVATIILKVLIYLPSKILLSQTAQTTSTWKPNEGVLVIEVVKILKRTKPKHRNRDLRRCPFCSITMWIPETPTFSLSLSLLPEQFYVFFYSSLGVPELNQPHKLKRCTNKFGPKFLLYFFVYCWLQKRSTNKLISSSITIS